MPTYNVAAYVEQAIDSIVSQGYPNLELLVVDGGSTDGTVQIIKKYERYIAAWTSEKDDGPVYALNKGFKKSTGEIMNWIGGDNFLMPRSLWTIGEIFCASEKIQWISSTCCPVANEYGAIYHVAKHSGISKSSFLDGCHTDFVSTYRTGYMQQEATFWRRGLWERTGGRLRSDLRYAWDFDLWCRFFCDSDIYSISAPLAAFRVRPGQISGNVNKYREEAHSCLLHLLGEISHIIYKTPEDGRRVYDGKCIVQSGSGLVGIGKYQYVILDAAIQKQLKLQINSGNIA